VDAELVGRWLTSEACDAADHQDGIFHFFSQVEVNAGFLVSAEGNGLDVVCAPLKIRLTR